MEPWHIKNLVLTDALTIPMAFGSQFMMPLFFILSGISTRFALGSRPAKEFSWKRILRLGVPVVTLGWFVLSPPQIYIEATTAQGYNAPPFSGTFWQFISRYFTPFYGTGGYFPWSGMHLWYLAWLLIFTLVSLPLFLYLRSPAGKKVLQSLGNLLDKPGAILAVGLVVYLPELLVPRGLRFLGWSEGGWLLATHWLLLILGFILGSELRLRGAMERHRWIALGLAVVTLFPLVGWAPTMGEGPAGSLDLAFKWGWRTLNGWFWLVAILGFGARHLNRPHPLLAYAGPAVLPFYILHQPLIVVLAYWLRGWPLAILPEYLLLASAVFVLAMGLYHFAIRRSRVLRFVFGMPAAGA
jgi:hypothetical protein